MTVYWIHYANRGVRPAFTGWTASLARMTAALRVRTTAPGPLVQLVINEARERVGLGVSVPRGTCDMSHRSRCRTGRGVTP